MSKVREVFERVDEARPNAFSESLKMMWLNSLEGRLAADVFLMSIEDIRQLTVRYPDDMDTELLVTSPHDDIYDLWLYAKIDFENGEYSKYQNDMAMFNEHYDNFVCWFLNTYDPAQGYVRSE